jgi:hypothetical protein
LLNLRPVVDYELRGLEFNRREIEFEKRRIAHEQRMRQLAPTPEHTQQLRGLIGSLLEYGEFS